MTTLDDRAPAVRTGGPRNSRRTRKHSLGLLFIGPAVLVELLVHIVPMLGGVATSFLGLTQYSIRDWTTAPFVGLKNYLLAVDPSQPIGLAFLTSIGVTFVLTVVVIAIAWTFAMGAALLVEDKFLKRKAALRVFFMLPFIVPAYVSAVAWRFMLQRDGVVNNLLVDTLHILPDKPFWLIGDLTPVSYVVTLVWTIWPFVFLYLVAGLKTIPAERYEAAAMDGANAWQRFLHVTLPGLRSVNSILILLLFLWTFNNFTTAFTLFGSAPPQGVDVLSVHVFRISFSTLNYGLGAAMSVIALLVLLAVTLVYWRALDLGRSQDA
jgi:multiple sugar transport system permease protein